jgi:broad specificity phosphatase PhoE
MSTTTVDLLRHGLVKGEPRLLGQVDEPLSVEGWSQMRAILDGQAPSWQSIFTSPLQRCTAFARELSERYGLPLVEDAGFQEIGFGEWEGRLVSELYQSEGKRLAEFWRDPVQHPAPGGEAYDLFEARVCAAWRTLLSSCQGQDCLVITHGGTIRSILRHVLDFPIRNLFQIDVPYACLTRVQIGSGSKPRILFHGGSL